MDTKGLDAFTKLQLRIFEVISILFAVIISLRFLIWVWYWAW